MVTELEVAIPYCGIWLSSSVIINILHLNCSLHLVYVNALAIESGFINLQKKQSLQQDFARRIRMANVKSGTLSVWRLAQLVAVW